MNVIVAVAILAFLTLHPKSAQTQAVSRQSGAWIPQSRTVVIKADREAIGLSATANVNAYLFLGLRLTRKQAG